MLKSRSLAAAALGFSLIFGGVASAQDNEGGTTERETPKTGDKSIDVDALIAKAKKKFSGFTDLTCNIKETIQIGPMPISTTNVVKLKKGGKFHVEKKSMMGNVTMVSNGTKGFMIIPQANRYADLPAGQGIEAAVPMLNLVLSIDKDQLATAGMEASASELSIDNVVYERLTLKVKAQNATIELDFNKDSGLLAKAKQSIKIEADNPNLKQLGPMAQQLAGQSINISREYTNMKLNTGVEDSVFDYTPDPGAQKFNPRRGMGGMGGLGLPGLGGKKKAPKKEEKKKDDEDF